MIWEQTKWKTGLGRQRKLQIKLQDYEDANYCAQPKNYERRKKMGSGIKLHLSPPPPPHTRRQRPGPLVAKKGHLRQ